MKLITHNMLTSKCLKGVMTGYPLAINATDVKVKEVDFNPDFIIRVIPKLDWNVLWSAAHSIGYSEGLPKSIEPKIEENDELLKKVHRVLLEVEIEEGHLTCPESGRQFPITKGNTSAFPHGLVSGTRQAGHKHQANYQTYFTHRQRA